MKHEGFEALKAKKVITAFKIEGTVFCPMVGIHMTTNTVAGAET